MKISALATLLIAATAHAAETKQHVRKAEGEAEKLAEAIEENWSGFNWPAPVCNAGHFSTQTTFTQSAPVCTIVPALSANPNQPGAPVGTTQEGVFCTDPVGSPGSDPIGPYSFTIETVPAPVGVSNLIRIVLNLNDFEQQDPPNGDRRLAVNPLVDPTVNGGDGAPQFLITFQGTWSEDCTFRAVSTQGGVITGNMDYWTHGHNSVNVDFTQSGQVTSPISSLGGQFANVVGLFVSNFAFAFSASFDDCDIC